MSSLFQRLNEDDDLVVVAPSLLSADFSRLKEEIEAVEKAGADCLHLDVMDGSFVPKITFGPMIVEAVARLTRLPLISHLMVDDPGKHVSGFVEAGSSLVSFHYEAPGSRHEEVIDSIKKLGCMAGLAINPGTPLSEIHHLLDKIDCLVVMTVFPGLGGQAFIPDVLEKIGEAVRLRNECGHAFVIEVDGGIKSSNAKKVREAGGRILVAGTAVFGSDDYSKAISSIRG